MPGPSRSAAVLFLRLLLLGASIFTIAPIHAIGMRQDVPESIYLDLANNAGEFTVGKFPDFLAVAAIGLIDKDGEFEVIGSGTLIAPEWVLTAAHVVLSGKRGQDFEANMEVRFGPSASSPRSRHPVSGVATPLAPRELRPLLRSGPRVSESDVIHAEFHDLALLRLTAPVTGIVPALLDETGEPLSGRPLYIAGFGDAATGNNTKSRTWTPADRKRAAENMVDREIQRNPYNPNTIGGILLFDFDNGTQDRNSLNRRSKSWDHLFGDGQSSPEPLRLEGASYPGDSGGPAFVKSAKGAWCVVGVSGYGTGFPPDRRRTSIQFGDILVYTRVWPHLAWVRQQIAPPPPTKPSAIVSPAGPAAEVGAPETSAPVTATATPAPPEEPSAIFRTSVPATSN